MNKRIFALFTVCLLIFSLAACGNDSKSEETSSTAQVNESSSKSTQEKPQSSETEESSEAVDSGTKKLVVYFSWSGNTKNVANEIALQTRADIFEIVPQTPYADDYDAVVDLAQQEQRDNVRPEIAGTIENIDDYDVVYVGFPNWWGDMPMILYTFFDTYDLSGKIIAPFCTSGGSGLSGTVSEIKSLEANAAVTDGLHIGDGAADDPEEAVTTWLQDIGLSN